MVYDQYESGEGLARGYDQGYEDYDRRSEDRDETGRGFWVENVLPSPKVDFNPKGSVGFNPKGSVGYSNGYGPSSGVYTSPYSRDQKEPMSLRVHSNPPPPARYHLPSFKSPWQPRVSSKHYLAIQSKLLYLVT